MILSFAIFSSFVGDIERLTAADKPSLDDSSGLFACQQQNQDKGYSVGQSWQYFSKNVGFLSTNKKTPHTGEY